MAYKRNKFGSVKTKYKGTIYHSKAEAEYSKILDGLLADKKIKSIQRQIRYKLPNMEGQLKMSYVADFVVVGLSGKEYIIDVKGVLTPENKVKLAYFTYYHKKPVEIVFTTGLEKFRTDFLV